MLCKITMNEKVNQGEILLLKKFQDDVDVDDVLPKSQHSVSHGYWNHSDNVVNAIEEVIDELDGKWPTRKEMIAVSGNSSLYQKDACTHMFITTLFTICLLYTSDAADE